MLLLLPSIMLISAFANDDRAPALQGLDPVALCRGNETVGQEDLEVQSGRYVYRFIDEVSRNLFLKDPERWGIQWGGGCARMGPLSGVGSPDRWAVYEGRIYIFASDGCRKGFLSTPKRFVVPAPKHPPIEEEAQKAGVALIERAVEAHGGAKAIDSYRAIRLTFEGTRSQWTHCLEQVIANDGSVMRKSRWTPPEADAEGSETTWVLHDESFVDEGEATFEVTSQAQLEDLRRFANRELITTFWARHSQDFLALHVGSGEFAGADVEHVLVIQEGLATTLHVNAVTGRILGLTWNGRLNDGLTRSITETFVEWREVQGIPLPISREVAVEGESKPQLASEWKTVELLSAIPEGNFAR